MEVVCEKTLGCPPPLVPTLNNDAKQDSAAAAGSRPQPRVHSNHTSISLLISINHKSRSKINWVHPCCCRLLSNSDYKHVSIYTQDNSHVWASDWLISFSTSDIARIVIANNDDVIAALLAIMSLILNFNRTNRPPSACASPVNLFCNLPNFSISSTASFTLPRLPYPISSTFSQHSDFSPFFNNLFLFCHSPNISTPYLPTLTTTTDDRSPF